MVELKYDVALVTGGAGFIGSHLCEELLRQNKKVICLDNMVVGKKENIEPFMDNPNFTLYKADIADFDAMKDAFKGVDVVFHNAASKCTVCRVDPKKDFMVNGWGSYNVYEASRLAGVKKVVHASTGSVYGELTGNVQNETHQLKPVSFYGVSKLAGERYSGAFIDYYDLDISIIRYFHVYGARQESSDVGGVIPIFIRRALNDQPLIIFGDGSQVRSFTYVKEDVWANFTIANSENTKGEAYNSVSGIKITIKELAEIILKILGKEHLEIRYEDWRPGDIKNFSISHEKIEKLGYKFKVGFDEGLKKTIEWYKEYFRRIDGKS